jgi:hypothetical protein
MGDYLDLIRLSQIKAAANYEKNQNFEEKLRLKEQWSL